MAFLELVNLRKFYGQTEVVKNFNLAVEKGEFISFLGPSGCGKTTTLRMVAGFETPTEGSIRIDGEDVSRLRPNARDIGMVFQAYALFPNMTVAKNVGFGMKVAGRPKAEIDARVAEMLELIGLPGLGERYPFQLSGGQQQRVALARALAARPKVLLLDEPLSALDAKIRISLREQIRAIQRQLGITTIYVTHDQEEALSMSDRIVVMNGGVAEQIGDPFAIYGRPATRFVATFVGQLNTIQGRLADPATGAVEIGGQRVTLGRALPGPEGRPVTLALRPEAVTLGTAGEVVIEAPVREVAFLGSVIRIKAALGAGLVSLDLFNTAATRPPEIGAVVPISFATADVLVIED